MPVTIVYEVKKTIVLYIYHYYPVLKINS
jgi:hypothetical protein